MVQQHNSIACGQHYAAEQKDCDHCCHDLSVRLPGKRSGGLAYQITSGIQQDRSQSPDDQIRTDSGKNIGTIRKHRGGFFCGLRGGDERGKKGKKIVHKMVQSREQNIVSFLHHVGKADAKQGGRKEAVGIQMKEAEDQAHAKNNHPIPS